MCSSSARVVLSITGNGLKTAAAVAQHVGKTMVIEAKLSEFDQLMKSSAS
jgi:threonine synthase